MKSDRIFKDFLKRGIPWRILLPLLIGLLLLLIPLFLGEREVEAPNAVTNDESRIAEVCSAINGVGECRAVVTYSSSGGEIASVAVIYTGSGSKETEKAIKDVITKLYGVGTNRIAVIFCKRE